MITPSSTCCCCCCCCYCYCCYCAIIKVSAPVRLMRLLVRENDSEVRKQMLRQKLLDVQVNNQQPYLIPECYSFLAYPSLSYSISLTILLPFLSFFLSFSLTLFFIASSFYLLDVHAQGTLTVDQQRADTAALMAQGELVLNSSPDTSPSADASSNSEVSNARAIISCLLTLLHLLFFLSFVLPVLFILPNATFIALPPCLVVLSCCLIGRWCSRYYVTSMCAHCGICC